jgi:HSP20 family protein
MREDMMEAQQPAFAPEKEEAPAVNGAERLRPQRAYVPRADIYETDSSIVIVIDMPGVDENNIDITLEKNVLTLNGYPDVEGVAEHSLAYAEYISGDYYRSFTLSDQIDRDGIEAVLRDGVLQLTLPKAGPAKARKISVKNG